MENDQALALENLGKFIWDLGKEKVQVIDRNVEELIDLAIPLLDVLAEIGNEAHTQIDSNIGVLNNKLTGDRFGIILCLDILPSLDIEELTITEDGKVAIRLSPLTTTLLSLVQALRRDLKVEYKYNLR